LAQARERQIALAGWAARNLDLPLLDHGLIGCGVRVLPGSPQWTRVVEALPGLLRAEAERGDRVALKLLDEIA
jgi:hypothetical protein